MKKRTFLSLISTALCTILVANVFTDSNVSALPAKQNLGSRIVETAGVGAFVAAAGVIAGMGTAAEFFEILNKIRKTIRDLDSDSLEDNKRCVERQDGTWQYSTTWFSVLSSYFHPYKKHAACVIRDGDTKYAEAGPLADAYACIHYWFPRSGKEAYWYVY